MNNPFTNRTTQRHLRVMAHFYDRQEPINYFPSSWSHLDAYIFLTLDPKDSGYNYYSTLNL